MFALGLRGYLSLQVFSFLGGRPPAFPHHSLGFYLWYVERKLIALDVVRQAAVGDVHAATIVEIPALPPRFRLIRILDVECILAQQVDQSIGLPELACD